MQSVCRKRASNGYQNAYSVISASRSDVVLKENR
jgi:hypothetical protein